MPPADFALGLAGASAPQVNAWQGRQTAGQAAALARNPHDHALAGAWVCTHSMRLGHHVELLDDASWVLLQLAAPGLSAQRCELLRCADVLPSRRVAP